MQTKFCKIMKHAICTELYKMNKQVNFNNQTHRYYAEGKNVNKQKMYDHCDLHNQIQSSKELSEHTL